MWSCWRSSDPHLSLVRSFISSPPSASSSPPVSSLLFVWQFIYGGARLMCLSASVVSKDTHYKEKTNTHSRTEGGHLTSSQRAVWEPLLVIRLNSALDVVTEESFSAAILLWRLKRFPFFFFLLPPFCTRCDRNTKLRPPLLHHLIGLRDFYNVRREARKWIYLNFHEYFNGKCMDVSLIHSATRGHDSEEANRLSKSDTQ